jgi:hypothetical protein
VPLGINLRQLQHHAGSASRSIDTDTYFGPLKSFVNHSVPFPTRVIANSAHYAHFAVSPPTNAAHGFNHHSGSAGGDPPHPRTKLAIMRSICSKPGAMLLARMNSLARLCQDKLVHPSTDSIATSTKGVATAEVAGISRAPWEMLALIQIMPRSPTERGDPSRIAISRAARRGSPERV